MTETAAEMPVGTVVAYKTVRAWIKLAEPRIGRGYEWACTNGGHYHNRQIDDEIFEGAEVLRIGGPTS